MPYCFRKLVFRKSAPVLTAEKSYVIICITLQKGYFCPGKSNGIDMKKALILLLTLATILSLASCGKKPAETTAAETTKAGTTETSVTTDAVTTAPETPKAPETTAAPAYEEVDETVYVYGTGILNVRAEASADSKLLGELKEGQSVKRTGRGNGWSRIIFDGKTCYASSNYLTTVAPFEYEERNETVYVVGADMLNLRTKASLYGDILVSVTYGQELKRTGISKTADENGSTWSRVEYDGKVCYANSAFLSLKSSMAADMEFTPMSDTIYVVAEQSLSLRSDASLSSSVVAYLGYGATLSRTGIAKKADADGILWSRVLFNGRTLYVTSSVTYISTLPTVKFTECNDVYYIGVDTLKLHVTPGLTSSTSFVASKGDKVTVTGRATKADIDGITWYKLLYEGEVCYASASFLSLVVPQ